MPIKTAEEVDHAIERATKIRDGLRIQKLEAHATIADMAVSALLWVKGEPSKFGEILAEVDAAVRARNAGNN